MDWTAMTEPVLRPLRLPALLGAALLLACSLFAAPGSVGAEPAGERFAERHRALDPAESARALETARGRAEGELRRRAGRALGETERVEVLRIDLHRLPKDARPEDYRRRADVYVYDYGADQLAWAVVDLDSNEVESLTVTPGVQLPLSEREVARAMDLLFADAASAARIHAQFERIAGRPLRDRSDLAVAGFVYRADAMPDSNSAESAACGRHRCAQLLIRTQDGVSIELPIVDLSRDRVLSGRWFGPPPATSPTDPGNHGAHDHAN